MLGAEAEGRQAAERLRVRVQKLGDSQQRLERCLAARLKVDHPGLMVMKTLIGDGPRTPTELAHRLELSPAAMSAVLNRLESAGHARRRRHPSDGRKLVVTATEESTVAALELLRPFIEGIGRIAARLSTSDRAAVEEFLDQLCALHTEVAQGSRRPDDGQGPGATTGVDATPDGPP